MKASLVCILILTVAAADFASFQQALEFDPQTLSGDNCGNDDSFTQQYEAFLPWIQLLEEGEIEIFDIILTQARDKIKLVREYIQDLDEELEKEQASNNDIVVEQHTQEPTLSTDPLPVQPAKEEVQEDDEEEENDDPFGWGAGEIPQQLLVDSKKKHNKNLKGHAKVLLEVMNKSKSLKYKSKIKRIIAMATALDTDMGTQDLQDRKNRKLQLCDLILDELINMIEFLEKVMNDYVQHSTIAAKQFQISLFLVQILLYQILIANTKFIKLISSNFIFDLVQLQLNFQKQNSNIIYNIESLKIRQIKHQTILSIRYIRFIQYLDSLKITINQQIIITEIENKIIKENTKIKISLHYLQTYQQEAYDIFKKKQEEIVEVANGCGARVISLQDTYSTSFVQTQPLKRNKKQNKEQKRKRKH